MAISAKSVQAAVSSERHADHAEIASAFHVGSHGSAFMAVIRWPVRCGAAFDINTWKVLQGIHTESGNGCNICRRLTSEQAFFSDIRGMGRTDWRGTEASTKVGRAIFCTQAREASVMVNQCRNPT